jgi:hypothetical protein
MPRLIIHHCSGSSQASCSPTETAGKKAVGVCADEGHAGQCGGRSNFRHGEPRAEHGV